MDKIVELQKNFKEIYRLACEQKYSKEKIDDTSNWIEHQKERQMIHKDNKLESKLHTLNENQRLLYDIVVNADKANKQELILLIGAAGHGKSHVLNELIVYL